MGKLKFTGFSLRILAVVVFFVALAYALPHRLDSPDNDFVSPTASKYELRDAKIVGWTAYWDEKNTIDSFSQNAKYLDSFSPILYRIEKDGSLGALNVLYKDRFLQVARENNLPVIPVLGDDFDFERVSLVLNDSDVQEKFIASLVDEAIVKGYRGWDIDIESLKKDDEKAFSRFISNAAEALHEKNLVLNAVVFGRDGKDTNDSALAENYEDLGEVADEVRIMMYGAHDEDTQPGGQAPIEWIRDVLDYAVEKVPREKLVVGLSTHGYDWFSDSASPLTYVLIEEKISEATPSVSIDRESSSAVYKYKKNGVDHQIWFENSETLSAKMILIMNEYQITKFALWRIGAEDPKFWEEFSR